jgi:hypothetical protein
MFKKIYHRVLSPKMRDRIHPWIHPRMAYVGWRARRYAAGVVQAGPFIGMKVPNTLGPHLVPLVLGTYELELRAAYKRLAGRQYSTVLDVGGGVGYYAVGVALWQPAAQVVVWEAEPSYHPLISDFAKENGVEDRVEIRGFCTIEELAPFQSAMESTLIIMDIEGYEAFLLEPEALPGLTKATIIVEFHDNMMPDCGAKILDRFRDTHSHKRYEPRHRVPTDYPIESVASSALFRRQAALAVVERPTWLEGRHGWFLLEPRSTSLPTRNAQKCG